MAVSFAHRRPVLTLLETRLFEPPPARQRRHQIVAAAIRIAYWPVSLADGQFGMESSGSRRQRTARPSNSPSAQSTAFVFSAILAEAHPLVVPMMIDQIGVGQEATAVSLLMEIAAGEHETSATFSFASKLSKLSAVFAPRNPSNCFASSLPNARAHLRRTRRPRFALKTLSR